MSNVVVISLGGSIVVPNQVDVPFVRRFVEMIRARAAAGNGTKLAIVVGGGATARTYQDAARSLNPNVSEEELDQIGIAATRVNARMLKAALGDLCEDRLVTDPTSVRRVTGSVIVGGGWKPGFSTDNVTVHLAESLDARDMINLSNIPQIFTADPKTDPAATPLTEVHWPEFLQIVGDEWVPGKNTPFDPVAARKASEIGMRVVVADGRNLPNLQSLLDGEPFLGTTIIP